MPALVSPILFCFVLANPHKQAAMTHGAGEHPGLWAGHYEHVHGMCASFVLPSGSAVETMANNHTI